MLWHRFDSKYFGKFQISFWAWTQCLELWWPTLWTTPALIDWRLFLKSARGRNQRLVGGWVVGVVQWAGPRGLAGKRSELAREIPTATCVRHFLPSDQEPFLPPLFLPNPGAGWPTHPFPCHAARNRDQSWTEVRTACCFSSIPCFLFFFWINIQTDIFV